MGQVPDTPGLFGERESGGGIYGGRQPWKAAREKPLVDPEGNLTRTSIYDDHSGMKLTTHLYHISLTTHLDHISHDRTASGTN